MLGSGALADICPQSWTNPAAGSNPPPRASGRAIRETPASGRRRGARCAGARVRTCGDRTDYITAAYFRRASVDLVAHRSIAVTPVADHGVASGGRLRF